MNGNASAWTALDFTPFYGPATKTLGKAVSTATDFTSRGMKFLNSPLTGNWTRFGNHEYRFRPGYVGMNGTPIERRATQLEAPPLEININTGEITPGLTPSRADWRAVHIRDIQNRLRTNLRREELTTDEMARITGDDLDFFEIRNPEGVKLGYEGPI